MLYPTVLDGVSIGWTPLPTIVTRVKFGRYVGSEKAILHGSLGNCG
jgi:hypothetical protein